MEERRFVQASPRPAVLRLGMALAVAASDVIFVRYGVWAIAREMFGPAADIIAGGMLISLLALAATGVAMLVLPRGIALDHDGFTVVNLGRRHHVRWSDVSEFHVARIPTRIGPRMVGFSYVPGFERIRRLRSFNRAVAGVDAALPDMYGLDPDELASLLERWRRAASTEPVR